MSLSPTFSAIMCDGMGWFTDLDYKRMLLTYDEIHYLLPQNLVPFKAWGDKTRNLYFSPDLKDDPSFKVYHFIPKNNFRQLILAAAEADISNPKFTKVISSIPEFEQRYTWQVVNSDGDMNNGESLALAPNKDEPLAHAILLNKFLLAAQNLKCVPITGKSYIHGMISEKYYSSVKNLQKIMPETLPPQLSERTARIHPFVLRLMSEEVPDQELERRSIADILRFKERNKILFERYSLSIRTWANSLTTSPLENGSESEIDDLLGTDVWKEKAEVNKELASAWRGFFRSAITSAVAGLAGVGIAPFLSLGTITFASVATAAIAISPWVTSELFKYIEAKKKAQEHGIYYLMKFRQ